MKMWVIGNPETVLGFSLVGVSGRAASTAEEAGQALDDALSAEGLGAILITQDAARLIGPRLDRLKLRSTVPLVVEIPSPKGALAGEPSLREVVQRAIGIKV
jgi:V/A-type H+-transporting ATPase subunit F